MGQKKIYSGGTIVTMEGNKTADAVLVEDGIIRAVGTLEQVQFFSGTSAEAVNLQGKTMLPAFLDPHSHITALASTLSLASLDGAGSFQEIAERLKTYVYKNKLKPGEWVLGFGYDQNSLYEHRHPTKELLDRVLPGYPVMISHKSGHMGVLSSKALEQLSITARTKNPDGGKIGRMQGSLEPNGYLEETAYTTLKPHQPSREQRIKQMEAAQQLYFSYGITTVQDGLTGMSEWKLLKEMADLGKLKADIVCYADYKQTPNLIPEHPECFREYRNRLKLGGYKIFLDGSPQGRTAWMTQPYEGEEDYRGYPIYSDAQVREFVEGAIRENIQLLAHCNGDAACEQLLCAFEQTAGAGDSKTRPVMIHAQFLRANQLPRMRKLGMIASFFVAHTYYWGDTHLKNFGERGRRISPAKSAGREGVTYTFHQDSPVLAPDMLATLWCACNRITANGVLLDREECLTPMEALRGVTVNAAYQYFEEDKKGSIAPGKFADFVLLDKNPLTVPKEELRDIRVLETIKKGETVFRRES